MIVKSNKTLGELKDEVTKYHQVLINVKTQQKINLAEHSDLQQAQLEIEQMLGDEGRVLIRASGTEPLIRVMVEAQNASQAQQSADTLANILRQF